MNLVHWLIKCQNYCNNKKMSNWNIIEITNKLYLIKYENINNTRFKCILSDLGSTWEEEISASDLLARAKEINPVVEIELEDLTKQILQLSADIQFEAASDQLTSELSLKFKLDGYTLKFNWYLSKSDNFDSSNDLMVSLICTLVKLKKQNTDLIDIIRKKDEEIEQHRFDGATLTREKLITSKFDVEAFHESAKQLHSKSNEFDQILANTDSTKHLLKLCNVDLKTEAFSGHGSVKESEHKPTESAESKKIPQKKKRKLVQKKLLPNRGPLNYGSDSGASDDNEVDDKRNSIQISRVPEKSKQGTRKRVPF